MQEQVMAKIIALAKRRGFIFPGSEIYGGLANTYDYGPVGTELLRNIKNLWWQYFVQSREDVVGIDASLISHHSIWEASGHVSGFTDAMVDCRTCKIRMRADHLIEQFIETHTDGDYSRVNPSIILPEELEQGLKTAKVEGWSTEKLDEIISAFAIPCPNCSKSLWTKVRKFNLLFPVQLGIVEGEGGLGYLRGETAQGMFINFKNVIDSHRIKLPFGIAQVGKSFRNEITPGNSIFRTIEFEQGEIEYFFDPDASDWETLYDSWKDALFIFVTKKLGIQKNHLRWREHSVKERSFYSRRTEDLEYLFPFGFKELWGLAYRTNYDLTQHQNYSNKDLTYFDQDTGKKFIPHVIEPAVGINRLLLMVLTDAYTQEESRVVLRISPRIAPVKVAIFPLLRNKPALTTKAKEIYSLLKQKIDGLVQYDDRGNIGKRYLSQDEIGTPLCITIDFQTIEDNTVTVRDRDTTKQVRIPFDSLLSYLQVQLV